MLYSIKKLLPCTKRSPNELNSLFCRLYRVSISSSDSYLLYLRLCSSKKQLPSKASTHQTTPPHITLFTGYLSCGSRYSFALLLVLKINKSTFWQPKYERATECGQCGNCGCGGGFGFRFGLDGICCHCHCCCCPLMMLLLPRLTLCCHCCCTAAAALLSFCSFMKTP